MPAAAEAKRRPAIVIGAGPAGLMAAEVISAAGMPVDVFDVMPSPARKFLRAGVGGLNLTHSEPMERFITRYGTQAAWVAGWLDVLDPQAVRDWAHGLGIDTFTGSSGRVFPHGMKAAPLLRAWLRRLDAQGVRLHPRHRWLGWDSAGQLRFGTPAGETTVDAGGTAGGVVLALGGGSWARLGSDGRWVDLLSARGFDVAPLQPANVGFHVSWSEHLARRWAGEPLKTVAARFAGTQHRGECLITRHGIEGGLIYRFSAALRDAIARDGSATLQLDLVPDRPLSQLAHALRQPRGRDSLANHLRRRASITGVKAALLRECAAEAALDDPDRLAAAIKDLPLRLDGIRPLDEAISSAGGLRREEVDADLMLSRRPGIFCAGEMLDWEAPTGGYLLTACLASGAVAGRGLLRWRKNRETGAAETPQETS